MKFANNPFYQEVRAKYAKQAKGRAEAWPISFNDQIAALEVELICKALRENKGNIQNAADSSGLVRSTFGMKMKKYALSGLDFR